MPRLKIQVPEQFTFSTPIPIRITDINYGNHVGNDAILSLIHEARVQFLGQYHYSELDIEGDALIMSDVGIEFRAELFYGDELTAYVTAGDFTRAGFDIYYKLVKGHPEQIVALAKTGMACYNYTLKKVVSVPGNLQLKLTT